MGGAAAPRRQALRMGFGAQFRLVDDQDFWQTGLANPVTPTNGARPVAFQVATGGNRSIPITVNGTHNFHTIPAWAGVQFRLSGTCMGVTIESAYAHWNPNGSFTANNFTFAAGVNIAYPFRAAGDWTWTFTAQNGNGALTAAAPVTRIEMYVFIGDIAPIFGGRHWVELLRLAVPDYPNGAGLNRNATGTKRAFMQDMAPKIWAFGPRSRIRYDCLNGAPNFAGGRSGGSFRLKAFLRPTLARQICNCYDLAGIVDLAFKALGTRPAAAQLVSGSLPFGQ
jgi:hypothetical protein